MDISFSITYAVVRNALSIEGQITYMAHDVKIEVSDGLLLFELTSKRRRETEDEKDE